MSQTEEPREREPGHGDLHALIDELREEMESNLRAQLAHVERTLAAKMTERLASADALIARLSQENARLAADAERQQRTLDRMRELALADRG